MQINGEMTKVGDDSKKIKKNILYENRENQTEMSNLREEAKMETERETERKGRKGKKVEREREKEVSRERERD